MPFGASGTAHSSHTTYFAMSGVDGPEHPLFWWGARIRPRETSPQLSGVLTSSTPIPQGQRCNQLERAWLTSELGPSFHFDAEMRAFFAETDGSRTLADALEQWHQGGLASASPSMGNLSTTGLPELGMTRTRVDRRTNYSRPGESIEAYLLMLEERFNFLDSRHATRATQATPRSTTASRSPTPAGTAAEWHVPSRCSNRTSWYG